MWMAAKAWGIEFESLVIGTCFEVCVAGVFQGEAFGEDSSGVGSQIACSFFRLLRQKGGVVCFDRGRRRSGVL